MKYQPSTHTPVQARTVLAIRFADIDRYGHVSTSAYIDYVFTSGFENHRKFGVQPETFLKHGIGYFTRRMTWEFIRPIPATETHVAVESFTPLIEGAQLHLEFKLKHPERDTVYATGTSEFRVINFKTGEPVPIPDWLLRSFYVLPEPTTPPAQ